MKKGTYINEPKLEELGFQLIELCVPVSKVGQMFRDKRGESALISRTFYSFVLLYPTEVPKVSLWSYSTCRWKSWLKES